jgi:hypothetical protein
LDGQKYQVFGYANDPITGFHATAYQSVDKPHNIIIAYRGTDTDLFSGKTPAERRDHALTTVQDVAVDMTMVRDTVNPQRGAADAFTRAMIAKAALQGISLDHVFVTGHSLGGTLAEIEAAEFGLTGATFNAYGALGLIEGPPQPGCHLTNYRMAGDVPSAANGHIGEVMSLASKEDVQSLHEGRYLDAPVGAPPPNTFLAMRLDDHSGQHFDSSSPDDVMNPRRLAEYAQRYADHKAAFDAYRADVFRERGELSQALQQMQEGYGPRGLPPDIQWQVNEYLAVKADHRIRNAIERSDAVQGMEHGLQSGADAARAVGHAVHTQDERVAAAARKAGAYALPLSPMASLAGIAVGEAAHLHGQAADAAARFAGDGLQAARGAVEQGAHGIAQAVVGEIHDPGVQADMVNVANHIANAYHEALAATQGIESAAGQVYDTLAHPGQWLQSGAAEASPVGAQAIRPAEPAFSHDDPRHPDHPQHGLFQELKERIPAAGENRLLQFTAVCHANKITARNLDKIGLNHEEGTAIFTATGMHVAWVDVKQPSPQPEQSIQQMQRYDRQQAVNDATVRAHMAQNNQQGMQGPGVGGPSR